MENNLKSVLEKYGYDDVESIKAKHREKTEKLSTVSGKAWKEIYNEIDELNEIMEEIESEIVFVLIIDS